jgi:hypothetical protein
MSFRLLLWNCCAVAGVGRRSGKSTGAGDAAPGNQVNVVVSMQMARAAVPTVPQVVGKLACLL